MNIQDIIAKNRPAIVLLDVQIPGDGQQKQITIKGTGFIISADGKFVTNAHVYRQVTEKEMPNMGVSVPGKIDEKGRQFYDRYPAKLLQIDDENDVALMQIVADKEFPTVEAIGDSQDIKEGDGLVYIGYPLAIEMLQMGFGLTMTTNQCIVSSIKLRGADGSMHFFLIDTHTNNGSSGSPVFSTDTGKVIGVVSGKISSRIPAPDGKMIDIPANIGICRPIKYINDLLEKNK